MNLMERIKISNQTLYETMELRKKSLIITMYGDRIRGIMTGVIINPRGKIMYGILIKKMKSNRMYGIIIQLTIPHGKTIL